MFGSLDVYERNCPLCQILLNGENKINICDETGLECCSLCSFRLKDKIYGINTIYSVSKENGKNSYFAKDVKSIDLVRLYKDNPMRFDERAEGLKSDFENPTCYCACGNQITSITEVKSPPKSGMIFIMDYPDEKAIKEIKENVGIDFSHSCSECAVKFGDLILSIQSMKVISDAIESKFKGSGHPLTISFWNFLGTSNKIDLFGLGELETIFNAYKSWDAIDLIPIDVASKRENDAEDEVIEIPPPLPKEEEQSKEDSTAIKKRKRPVNTLSRKTKKTKE